jgi:hypothetical protein
LIPTTPLQHAPLVDCALPVRLVLDDASRYIQAPTNDSEQPCNSVGDDSMQTTQLECTYVQVQGKAFEGC